MKLKGRDFLTLLDYTPEEIAYLLDLSAKLKEKKKAGIPHRLCEGKNIALIFEKTSTRTRCSFEVAARDLGMSTTYLDPAASAKKKALQTLRAYFREYLMGSNIAVFLSIQSKNSRNTPLFPCGTV